MKNVFEYNKDGSFKRVNFWATLDTLITFQEGNSEVSDSFTIYKKLEDGNLRNVCTKYGREHWRPREAIPGIH